MKKIVIITNAPAPYRVAFFKYIQDKICDYKFHIVYISQNNDIGRKWKVQDEELGNHTFLKSKVITIKKKYDDKRIMISYGIVDLLKKMEPDAVICMEYNITIIQAVHWCNRNKIPYLSWSDGTAHSEQNINKIQKKFRKYVIKNAAGYISSSTATMEHQISYGAIPEKCFKSLLTVDVEQYLMKKKDNHRVQKKMLFVGGLIGRKGLDLLIKAMPYIEKNILLDVVGEGTEESNLRNMALEYGVADRISFLGYLEGEELKKSYQSCDIFVFPTREDCFGLVILEAMCASLPVIASKYADGAFDLIKNDIHGKIIDPYNTQELAQAVNWIFKDEKKLRKMQDDCYNAAEKMTFEKVAEGFFEGLDYVCK